MARLQHVAMLVALAMAVLLAPASSQTLTATPTPTRAARSSTTNTCYCKINKKCANTEDCKAYSKNLGAAFGGIFGGIAVVWCLSWVVLGLYCRKKCIVCSGRSGKHGPVHRNWCISVRGCCVTTAYGHEDCIENDYDDSCLDPILPWRGECCSGLSSACKCPSMPRQSTRSVQAPAPKPASPSFEISPEATAYLANGNFWGAGNDKTATSAVPADAVLPNPMIVAPGNFGVVVAPSAPTAASTHGASVETGTTAPPAHALPPSAFGGGAGRGKKQKKQRGGKGGAKTAAATKAHGPGGGSHADTHSASKHDDHSDSDSDDSHGEGDPTNVSVAVAGSAHAAGGAAAAAGGANQWQACLQAFRVANTEVQLLQALAGIKVAVDSGVAAAASSNARGDVIEVGKGVSQRVGKEGHWTREVAHEYGSLLQTLPQPKAVTRSKSIFGL